MLHVKDCVIIPDGIRGSVGIIAEDRISVIPGHGLQLSVFIPCIGIDGAAVGFACPQTIGVVGIRPSFATFGCRLHLPAFPGEGVDTTVIKGF